MAEDLRQNDPEDNRLNPISAALVLECRREEESCLYSSTTFYIWLRFLRALRGLLWIVAAVAGGMAASHNLRSDPENKTLSALAALLAVILPGIGNALRLDRTIRDYESAAGKIKNLQGEFRRAAKVCLHKPVVEFDAETRKLFKAMNEARKPSLTPPDFCFWLAQRKIRKGHYRFDADDSDATT
ncbi:MAG: hypothetical protein EXQ88_06595 [Alphaproteobacteria bacterium]|nr:hypothetical protein [Alphaproteobacteria bacterium]